MADISMRVLLSVAGASGVVSAVKSVTSAFSSGGLAGALGATALAASALAVGIGVQAVQSASSFQTAMLNLESHAGLAASQVQTVNNALLQMGPAVGQGPTQLAQALYPILSSFSGMSNQAAKTQLSLSTLDDAAKSVAGTTTNIASVTNAATAVFNAYGFATGNAARDTAIMNNVFDIANKTITNGNMQWADYSNVIGKLSVSAHGAGVAFNEENAALSTLTNNGYSAQLAGTYLSNTFTDLYIKSDNLAKNAKSLGINFDETKYKTMNLGDRIKYLSQVTDGNQSKLLKLLGGNSVALKTFDALSGSIGQYTSNLNSLGQAQGATSSAFQTNSQAFSFSMQKIKAAGSALMITLGQALLPTVTKIATAVLPAIQHFTTWLTTGNRLQNGLHAVGTVVKGVAGFIGGLVTGGERVVSFFQHCQVAALALLVPLGALGGLMVAQAVSAIPGMIVQLSALATGYGVTAAMALASAAAELAAAAPFILIGAAIAAVIAIIILLVTHWGQVVSFLRTIWTAFSAWFGNAIHAVGQFFVNLWNGILNGLHAAWNAILGAIKAYLNLLVTIWTLPFRLIGALFSWLYQHNVYFQKLVDKIRMIVFAGLFILQQRWQQFVQLLAGIWRGIVNTANTVWRAISGAITGVVHFIVGWLTAQWMRISENARMKLAALQAIVQQIWQKISSIISGAWNTYIVHPLQNLWNNIVNFASGWPKQALQWGINLIESFGKGIQNALGNLGKTLGNVGGTIANFLGFHSPTKEGPGQELNKWPDALIRSYGAGLVKALPQLQSSLNLVMRPVASTLSGHTSAIAPSSISASRSALGSGSSVVVHHQPVYNINVSTMAGSPGEVRRMTNLIQQEMARQFRSTTPGYNSGLVF